MTHPTPTAAKSASPPPRGEGLGVGRRLRPTCHSLALTLLLTTAAQAQIIPTGTPAADILLSQAIADQRVFLTCTALDGENHRTALDFWAADVAAAVTLLTDHGTPPEAIAAFQTAAAPETMMPAADTPFADVQAYCLGQGNWFAHWSRRDFTELAARLPKVLP